MKREADEEGRDEQSQKARREPDLTDGMGRSGGSEGEGERGILLVKARDFPKMVAAQGSFLERVRTGQVTARAPRALVPQAVPLLFDAAPGLGSCY